MAANERDGVVHKQPKTAAERIGVASVCQESLKLTIPMLVDSIDDATNKAYAGWPDRLCVVDRDGKIAYRGGPGPGGFRPDEMRQALEKLLSASP